MCVHILLLRLAQLPTIFYTIGLIFLANMFTSGNLEGKRKSEINEIGSYTKSLFVVVYTNVLQTFRPVDTYHPANWSIIKALEPLFK